MFRWFLASEDDTEEESSSSRVELRPSEHRGQEPASLEERAEITSEDSSSVLTITSAVAGDRWCTVLYCTVLYCTVLYCTVLYCTVAEDGCPGSLAGGGGLWGGGHSV